MCAKCNYKFRAYQDVNIKCVPHLNIIITLVLCGAVVNIQCAYNRNSTLRRFRVIVRIKAELNVVVCESIG